MHNYARAKARRAALRASSPLQKSSDLKPPACSAVNAFSHYACGRKPVYYFDKGGYTCRAGRGYGENIYWGTGSLGSVRAAMKWWVNSTEGHRTTLLNSTYKDVGFGLRKGTFLGHRGAQVWTGHFGYRKC
ncbi:MAG: CAP domain-containing protein [Actinomycetota bacterium]|jgi:uncharacterized protein YkwD|nr:CAP domain-containing protein [Actinomycetota bacterium]MDQ3319167.1 CAP domain-containing protein [Actinomycetota bacterium]MDQ3355124.1 CAP domain-containing protein [Actinomycetota bacterium]